jgi:hypothetical protein
MQSTFASSPSLPATHPGRVDMFTPQTLTGMPSNPAPSALSVEDQDVLRVRAIAPLVAAQRGCRTVTASEARRYGFRGNHARSGLLIPSFGTQGEIVRFQLRPHEPVCDAEGRSQKYLWPPGSRQSLDVPPTVQPLIGQVDTPVILTESSFKGDALVSAIQAEGAAPHAVLAIAGVWGWRSHGAPLSDFGDMPWCRRGRDRRITFRRMIFLALDSDALSNTNVTSARWELSKFLRRKGAVVHWIDVPPGPDGAKEGVDDYLAGGGTLAALLAAAYPFPNVAPALALTPKTDMDAPEVERLRTENASLRQLASAQAELLRNPHLKDTSRQVGFALITEAHAKAGRGEVEPDGRVRLEVARVVNDHRPKARKGEPKLDRNPQDGSFPLTSRDNGKTVLSTLMAHGAIDAEFLDVIKQHPGGDRYRDKDVLVRVTAPVEAIRRLACYDGYKRRKAYERTVPCVH